MQAKHFSLPPHPRQLIRCQIAQLALLQCLIHQLERLQQILHTFQPQRRVSCTFQPSHHVTRSGRSQILGQGGGPEAIRFVGVPVLQKDQMLRRILHFGQRVHKFWLDGSQRIGNGQGTVKLGGGFAVLHHRQTAMQTQRFGRHIGGNVRVPVPVAANPGTKGKEALGRCEGWIIFADSLGHAGVNFGDGVPNGGVHIVKAGFYFISDGDNGRSCPVRQPQGSHFGQHAGHQVVSFRRQQITHVQIRERARDAAQLGEHRPAFGLRGVSGEDQFNV